MANQLLQRMRRTAVKFAATAYEPGRWESGLIHSTHNSHQTLEDIVYKLHTVTFGSDSLQKDGCFVHC